ncbi:MAG: hypothetical protein ACLFUC_03445 [Bacteroidales bacterium]
MNSGNSENIRDTHREFVSAEDIENHLKDYDEPVGDHEERFKSTLQDARKTYERKQKKKKMIAWMIVFVILLIAAIIFFWYNK